MHNVYSYPGASRVLRNDDSGKPRIVGSVKLYPSLSVFLFSSMLSLKSFLVLSLVGTVVSLPRQGLAESQQGSPVAAQPSVDAQGVLANAIELHQAGDFEGAIREYRIFLATSPKDNSRVIAYSNLGAALAHLGRYTEAIEQYRQALQAIPEGLGDTSQASGVHFNLAVAYYKSGQIPNASRELADL